MTYSDIRFDVADGVAHIELHRPDALNAWTTAMADELADAVSRAGGDATVRSVLVSGAGRAFCAGADVKDGRELLPDGTPDLGIRLRERYNPLIRAIRTSPKPFVAAVHGACAGLGVSLALACDLIVAAENSYLLLAFVRIGVMPDAGVTAFLAERVGLARAAELCLLGDRLPAPKALDWGLVNAVHPPSLVHAEGRALATRLAAGPTVAIGNAKRALTAAAQARLADQLELEATLQTEHGYTADYAEGRAAFIDKRPAKFTGQ